MSPSPTAGGARTRGLRCRLRDERGSAVVTAITLIVVGLTLATAAVVTATNVLRGSARDEQSKEALAAADAGAQIAVYRYNQIATDDALPCVIESLGGDLIAGDATASGWCDALGGQVGDASYSYLVRPSFVTAALPGGTIEVERRLEIVSTGTSGPGFQDPLTRRIEVAATAPLPGGIFADFSVVGRDSIALNSNSEINGNAATNGDITLGSNAILCGNAQVGVGQSLVLSGNSEQCSGYATSEGTVSLPGVNQGDVVTSNSNGRFFAQDPISGNSADVSWNATTRVLEVNSNSAVTLGGTDYSFCQLILDSNTSLIVADGASVRIFFDAPENCINPADGQPYAASDAPVTQIQLNSNSQLTTTSGDPGDLALLMVGSETIATTVDFNSNTNVTMPIVLYAPNTDVNFNSNATYRGGIAAKSVHLDSNATVTSDDRAPLTSIPVYLRYEQERYVECGPAGTNPDDNC